MAGRKKGGNSLVLDRIAALRKRFQGALSSINVLFGPHLHYPDLSWNGLMTDRQFIDVFRGIMELAVSELDHMAADLSCARIWREIISEGQDSVDLVNLLVCKCGQRTVADVIASEASEAVFILGGCSQPDYRIEEHSDALIFLMKHADRLMSDGISSILEYHSLIRELDCQSAKEEKLLERVHPSFAAKFVPSAIFKYDGKTEVSDFVSGLFQTASCQDLFLVERVFKYSAGSFITTTLGPIRGIKNFFGYHPAREFFTKYFSDFSQSGVNLPLLISSLPGLGKTHFTISHALSFKNISLILCEPHDIEKPLEGIIRELSLKKGRRFVLFFDDVDTRQIDWYYFRTYVGGSYVLPDNLAIVIASNFEFPANIYSRGRGFTFPVFDEIRCQEMVHDFISSLGMRQPPSELVSVIASNYVEEFAQHMFEELSPRTLVRYLEKYMNDAEKRKKMLNLSREKVVPLPDPAVFMEANQKIIERLNKAT